MATTTEPEDIELAAYHALASIAISLEKLVTMLESTIDQGAVTVAVVYTEEAGS